MTIGPLYSRLVVPSLAVLMIGADSRDDLILFNGRNLDGWVAEGVGEYLENGKPHPVWSVEEGRLVCHGKGFGFLRYDRQPFSDFVFHAEFRMAPGCNSGLGLRTRSFDPARSRATRPSFFGYEVQLFDDAGRPPSVHSSGSLYRYVAPKKNPIRRSGEWNEMEITCVGPLIKIIFNGEQVIDFDQWSLAATRDKPLAGYLCLQNHGGNIEFRSIQVRQIGRQARKTNQQ